jgi:hypothetical protein
MDSTNTTKISTVSNAYLCPLHKVLQYGTKRTSFEKELHEAIVNSSMDVSQSLYKHVLHGCHCQANYKRFDTLTSPKASEQTTT